MQAQTTKEIFANALIQLCTKKSFRKLNVADIASYCEFNRQTFYYHFTDKYDLLAWTYEYHAVHYLGEDISIDNWYICTEKMLQQMVDERSFYQNTIGDGENVLMQTFIQVVEQRLLRLINRLDISDQLSKKERLMYASFFAHGCWGILAEWITKGFKEEPTYIAQTLLRLAKDVEKLAYERYVEVTN